MNAKNLILFVLLLSGLTISNLVAQKPVQLQFTYKFINVVEGYDHISRMKVYVDGNLAGTSTPAKESAVNTLKVDLSKGEHTIRAVMETEYEGVWEEHVIALSYSIDCLYEKLMNFTKKLTKIVLEFDINSGTNVVKKFTKIKK